MILISFFFFLQNLVGGYFLWLGLFILTRSIPLSARPQDLKSLILSPAFASGLAFSLVSVFMFGVAMRSITPVKESYVLWQQLTWWTVPIAVGFWFRAILLLNEPAENYKRNLIAFLVPGYGIFVAGIGTFTEAIFRYSEAFPLSRLTDHYLAPLNYPFHLFYSSYLLGVLWLASFILFRQYRSITHRTYRRLYSWLAIGNSLLAVGATVSVVGYLLLEGLIPEQVGDTIAASGLLFVGHSIVHYNALVNHQIIAHDFRRSLRTVLFTLLITLSSFGSVFIVSQTPFPYLVIPTLIFVVTSFFTSLQWTEGILNKLALQTWEHHFALQVAQIRQAITVAPDQQQSLQIAQDALLQVTQQAQVAQLQNMIVTDIGMIFRHNALNKDDVMGNSRLLMLNVIQPYLQKFKRENSIPSGLPLSEREKARVLRHFLTYFIENEFRPHQNLSTVSASDRWIEYIILSRGYLEGKKRREVINEVEKLCGIRLSGSESTGGRVYTHHLQNARQNLATLLWQAELRQLESSGR